MTDMAGEAPPNVDLPGRCQLGEWGRLSPGSMHVYVCTRMCVCPQQLMQT